MHESASATWVARPGLDPFFAYDAKYLIDNKAGIIIDAVGTAELTNTGNIYQGHIVYYRVSKSDCSQCSLKPKCTTATARKITCDLDEDVLSTPWPIQKPSSSPDVNTRRSRCDCAQEQGPQGSLLSPHLLELLRAWYKAARPKGRLFPRMDPVRRDLPRLS